MLAFCFRRASPVERAAALIALALAFGAVVINCWSVSFSGKADAFGAGEWLINYGGGWVRRGLGGSAILWTSELSGLRPRSLLFLILLTCYITIFLPLGRSVWRERDTRVLDLLLVVSPFAATFPALHYVAGARKEILLLALASLAYRTRLGELDSRGKYLFWSVSLAIVVAVHDALIFFLPLFLWYLRTITPAQYVIGWRAIPSLLPAAAVFAAGYAHSGRVDIGAICSSLQQREPGDWCVPSAPTEFLFAASWLHATALDGFHSVLKRYTLLSGLWALVVGAAGLPLLVLAWAKDRTEDAAIALRQTRDWVLSPLYLVGCAASVAVVFAVGTDWNRWFYVVTSLLTMAHLAVKRSPVPQEAVTAAPQQVRP